MKIQELRINPLWLALPALLLFTAAPSEVFAIKAQPGVGIVTQPDGSAIAIKKYGDEFFNYTTTADGYVVAQNQDGFYYYADYNSGMLNISDSRVGGSAATRSGTVMTKYIPASTIIQLSAKGRALKSDSQASAMSRSATRAGNMPQRALVLLVEFSDVRFTVPNALAEFTNMLNADNYTTNSATGSAKQYYYESSMEEYSPQFDVTGIITLDKTLAHYGANQGDEKDVNVRQMVVDACAKANAAPFNVDFSLYDADNNGEVDIVYIFYAGYSEATNGVPSTAIWPHQWSVYNMPGTTFNGKQLRKYACSSELWGNSGTTIDGIGAFCHEYGHVIGLPDFYNTDGGSDLTLGYYSIMDLGNYLNESRTPPYLSAVERELLGWLVIDDLTESGDYTLESVDKNKAYKMETENPGEYFVIENRTNTTVWDRYIGGSGLLIYHVDKSQNMVNGVTAASRWTSNSINNYASHHCMRLRPATAGDYQTSPVIGFFPGSSNVKSFTSTTSPGSIAWNRNPVGTDITAIAVSGGTASFTATVAGPQDVIITAANPGQTDAYISWGTKDPGITQWIFEWKVNNEEIEYNKETASEKSFRIENLTPGTKYVARIASVIGVEEYGQYAETAFTTTSVTMLFPGMDGIKSPFSVGDILVLRINNLQSPTSSIVWKLNGEVVSNSVALNTVGTHTLTCEITYAEGGTESGKEVITRRIKVQ